MTFQNYNLEDNAFGNLLSGISASDTTISLESGQGSSFPSSNFIITLVQYATTGDESTTIEQIEKVLCSNRSSDTLTVTRGFDGDTPLDFDAGDNVYLNVVSAITEDIQDEVARLESDKLDTSSFNSGLRNSLTAYRLFYVDSTGQETELSFGTAGQVLVSQGATSNPVWQAQSTDINGLTENTSVDSDDEFIVYDTSVGSNKKINRSNLFNKSEILYFGDGEDGDVTISSNTTLTRDMYYNNLTIDGGVTLNTNNYRIFVKGTLDNNGIIRFNGNDGEDGESGGSGSTGGAGGAGGAYTTSGLLNSITNGSDGGQGGSGSGGDGNDGVDGTSETSYLSLNGVSGGAGGNDDGTGGNGGVGGISNEGKDKENIRALIIETILRLGYKISGGAGGGGGGGGDDSGFPGGGGGGGGTSGGLIRINARVFDNSDGTIEAKGGNGGAGGTGGVGIAGADGGGGGGGNGGFLLLIYNSKTDGVEDFSGGTGGSSGEGINGDDGNSGSSFKIQI